MGRYYHGDIEGKFAFGRQSSNAFDYFKDGTEIYCFYYCGCEYDPELKQKYCRNCHSSYKDFKREHPEPFTEEMKQSQNEATGLHYEFDADDLSDVIDKLHEIEISLGGTNHVNNVLTQINYKIAEEEPFEWETIQGNNENITPANVNQWDLYLIGLQLKKCLETTGYCGFDADYN